MSAYSVVLKWPGPLAVRQTNPHPYNIRQLLPEGIGNQVANIINGLVRDPQDTYAKTLGYENLTLLTEDLSARIDESKTQRKIHRAMADLSPQDQALILSSPEVSAAIEKHRQSKIDQSAKPKSNLSSH